MTATELIYQAAMKVKGVPLANGKTAKYEDVKAEKTNDPACWLCGSPTNGEGVPAKKAIKPTFTDGSLARAPHSEVICKACAFCLSYRELRNYSIVATPISLKHPIRAELRDMLLDPPEPPFAICAAVSGQKWLHIKADVAYSRDYYPVQMEDTPVLVKPATLAGILEPVEELYAGGFRKSAYKDMPGEIEDGAYESWKIKQFGIGRWEELENIIAPWRGTRIFQLALFVAQKGEK